MDPLTLTTDRLIVRTADLELAAKLSAYAIRNLDHFAASSPITSAEDHTEEKWRARIETDLRDLREGRSLKLVLLDRSRPDEIVGDLAFTNIVGGVFRACHLGYRLDERAVGRGLMFEALRAAIAHAFGPLELHRIMANYMPTNERSGRLLRRLGFVHEGYARDYLFLGGAWRDHVLTALVTATP